MSNHSLESITKGSQGGKPRQEPEGKSWSHGGMLLSGLLPRFTVSYFPYTTQDLLPRDGSTHGSGTFHINQENAQTCPLANLMEASPPLRFPLSR